VESVSTGRNHCYANRPDTNHNTVESMLGLRFRAWLPALVILEVGGAFIALAAMGEITSSAGGGNRIARMALESPGPLESFLFYFVLSHVLIFLFYMAAKYYAQP